MKKVEPSNEALSGELLGRLCFDRYSRDVIIFPSDVTLSARYGHLVWIETDKISNLAKFVTERKDLVKKIAGLKENQAGIAENIYLEWRDGNKFRNPFDNKSLVDYRTDLLPPFRVKGSGNFSIEDSEGRFVVAFPFGYEKYAADYCNYLNRVYFSEGPLYKGFRSDTAIEFEALPENLSGYGFIDKKGAPLKKENVERVANLIAPFF